MQKIISEKEELDEKLEELPSITLQLLEKQDEIDNLQTSKDEELEILDKEKEELKKKLRGKNEEIVNLSLEKEEMMQSLEELDTQHQEEMQHLIKIKDQLSKSNDEHKKKVANLETELQTLKSHQMLSQADESSSSNELNHQIAELKDEISELTNKLEKQENQLNTLEREKQAKDEKIKEMVEKMAAGATALNDLHMDKQELQDKVNVLKEDIAKQVEKVKGLREDNNKLHDESSKSEEAVQHASSHELLKLEEENNDMKLKLDNIESKLKQTTKENDQTKLEMNELNEKYSSLTRTLEQRNSEVGEITDELNESQKQMSDLKEKLESASSDCDRLQKESDKMHADCESFSTHTLVIERELNTLKEDYTSKEKENTQLSNQVEMFSNQLVLFKDNLEEKNEECDKLSEELKQTKNLLQDSTDRLHSKCEENNDLAAAVDKYRADIKDMVSEKEADYDAQLLSATGELVLVKEELSNKTEEWQRLEAELYVKESEITDLQSSNTNQSDEISHYKKELENMQKQQLELVEEHSKATEKVSNLEIQCQAVTNENDRLKSDLGALDQKLSSQVTHYENFIEQLKTSKDSSTSSLQQQYDDMLEQYHKKDLQISELEEKISNSYSQMQECQKELEGAIEKSESLQHICDNYKKDLASLEGSLTSLKSENATLTEHIKNLELSVSEVPKLRDQLKLVEHDKDSLKEEQDKYNVMISTLTVEKESLNDKVQELEQTVDNLKSHGQQNSNVLEAESKEKNMLVERVSLLETEKQNLSCQISEKDTNLDKLSKEKEAFVQELHTLKDDCVNKDKQLSDLQHKFSQANVENLRNNDYDQTDKGVIEDSVVKVQQVQLLGTANGSLENDCYQHERDVAGEIDRLKGQLDEKDSVISELQRNNGSLLKMLDAKARSSGDTSHIDVLNLENEVKSLKREREQMMDVLNEKSRECSNARTEVQRLMNVLAAQKTALEKLQKDNHDLSKTSPDKDGARIDDMQKEVVQNLSRIIRDKDLEIESLSQKNETLLSVLQESSSEGTQINSLMQDKENLSKQMLALQSEREQMIAYLNQKHQESVAYHTEVQRLTALISSDNETNEKIRQEYDLLKPQFEDKKQVLLKTQNELLNYKQKYQELEVKCGQLMQQSGSGESVDKGIYEAKVHEAEKSQERYNDIILATKEKEMRIQNLSQQINELEQNLRVAENERGGYKKQVDNFTFQLHGIQTEHADLKGEVAQLTQQKDTLAAESYQLKDLNNRLTLQAQDSNFQIQSLSEKVQSLTSGLQQQQGEKGHLQTVIQENEATQNQKRQLMQERDHSLLRLQNKEEENIKLQKEVCDSIDMFINLFIY